MAETVGRLWGEWGGLFCMFVRLVGLCDWKGFGWVGARWASFGLVSVVCFVVGCWRLNIFLCRLLLVVGPSLLVAVC